jgi:hypothetical protein
MGISVRKVMTKTICHTILLDLVVICDLLVTHHPPDGNTAPPVEMRQ